MVRKFFLLFYKLVNHFRKSLCSPLWKWYTMFLFYIYNVKYQNFSTAGIPRLSIKNSGSLAIGNDFKMNNAFKANIIGRQQPCIFFINRGELKIGNNVGMSSTAIVCQKSINIGNNVRIGGNVVIYDTDFHSINPVERLAVPEVKPDSVTKSVEIGNNVFIGAHTTILKGTEIGDNSVIGAGSVVVGCIPSNEIWAGSPIKFIKKVNG